MQSITLIVGREQRIGDNWRNRYHALTLHNQVAGQPPSVHAFSTNWPTYIPKDKLAGWFEAYVESMELSYWAATEFRGGAYDEREERWAVVLHRADGTTREMRPRHIVMATGASGIPNLPDIRRCATSAARSCTPANMLTARNGRARTPWSSHRQQRPRYCAGPLLERGQVTLVQRSPTLIVNIEPSAQLPYALYDEGPPLEDCDLINTSIPLPLARKSPQALTEQARKWTRGSGMEVLMRSQSSRGGPSS